MRLGLGDIFRARVKSVVTHDWHSVTYWQSPRIRYTRHV